MLIEDRSKYYLKKIRAKSKMFEYNVPEDLHIRVESQSNDLILLCIAIIGDVADEICHQENAPIILREEMEEELHFVARFFDAYYQTNLDYNYNEYYILMGAVAYYFCNMNGSSKVLINTISNKFEFNASGLEKVIIWLIDDNYKFHINEISKQYRKFIVSIINFHNRFFAYDELEKVDFKEFKIYVYKTGNSREVLFVDLILSILKKKIFNSCINLMPLYTNLPKEKWRNTFINNSKIREMWLSQIFLGENDIFKGKSGVIQMPTSSGKTTSVALAIQSSFLSERTDVVIIVAPFRALCREILFDLENFFYFDDNVSVTEFSDIPENSEIDILSIDSSEKKVFVMTPEKLSYILKHNKEVIDYINMIVFDEAHLFDDESRGTDYELLLATIKYYIKPNAQKLLVSAVISNASQLNEWINEQGVVVKNDTIKTTEKTVAFNTFHSTNKSSYSNLYFVDPMKGLEEEFFVPRVIQPQKLKRIGKERKIRYFPDLTKNKQDVSIYYAIKLVKNGSIAIFCTRKDTVNKVLARFIDLEKRGVSLANFIEEADIKETKKLAGLIKKHLGENSLYFAALKGIIGHHSGVPNGIKISTEYALRNSLLSCVVCTSTLAQGVNLPLKYLIISSVYQSREVIKVRDFHNLLGRTARAGKQTEGTIILTENIYKGNQHSYKLDKYKRLLNTDNSEGCSSNLLKIVRDVELSNNMRIPSLYIKQYIRSRYFNLEEYFEKRRKIIKIKDRDKNKGEEILYKIKEIENILISLETFILNFLDVEENSAEIIKLTYGYFLSNATEKQDLVEIYEMIRSSIDSIAAKDKLTFSKSMLGIMKMKELSRFVDDHILQINNYTIDELIDLIADQISKSKDCKMISKLKDDSIVSSLLKLWLSGITYIEIFNYASLKKINVRRGTKYREILLDDIISLCNYDFGYVSLPIIQSLIEILDGKDCSDEIINRLNDIISRIRYGLPNQTSINVYELGFSDRIISQKIADQLEGYDCCSKKKTKRAIRECKKEIESMLLEYPTYFLNRLRRM